MVSNGTLGLWRPKTEWLHDALVGGGFVTALSVWELECWSERQEDSGTDLNQVLGALIHLQSCASSLYFVTKRPTVCTSIP